jgi:hypothetical protein
MSSTIRITVHWYVVPSPHHTLIPPIMTCAHCSYFKGDGYEPEPRQTCSPSPAPNTGESRAPVWGRLVREEIYLTSR